MCGFAGVYEHGTVEASVSPDLIVAMRDTLRHRGPDGEGLFVSRDSRVGLGHRRLAVVDIPGGAQPMYGRAGECLVYNGEIYNYPRLRHDLEAEGVPFDTRCDTEVLLRLYERHGLDCLQLVDGMFAFALWDEPRQRLLLARDRLGEKPLYWSDVAGRLVFASEMKALLAHPAIHPELDHDALSDHLTHLVTPPPRTLIRGIFKLAPGEMAVCDAHGPRVSRYWQLFAPRRWTDTSLPAAATAVRATLERSVKERLLGDLPVGALLSGGLDSTAILALLAELSPRPPTFSVGFSGEPAYDERAHARRVARHFGAEHHDVTLSEQDALALLPRLIHHQDEPLADPVSLPLHLLCALVAGRDVKVVLAGEGSDELFWGYPRYQKVVRWWPLIRILRQAPRPLRHLLSAAVPASRHPRMRDFLEGLAMDRMPPMHMPAGVPRSHREMLLGTGSPAALPARWAPSADLQPGVNPFDTLAFDTQEYELALRLPERLLMRLDRVSMANGVEARAPFLDRRLVELAYRLPIPVKLRSPTTKLALRRAVSDLVPPWVLERPKQGFDVPVERWLAARVGRLLRSLAREDALRSCFQTRGLEDLLRSRPSPANRLVLWSVLNFVLWHLVWIEGRDIHAVLERAATTGP